MILIKNEGIVDKHGHHLMPATPIFLKHRFFKIGPQNQHFLKKIKKKICSSCSVFIGLFNGTLFVLIMSWIGDKQKEMFLPSHLNWPPLHNVATQRVKHIWSKILGSIFRLLLQNIHYFETWGTGILQIY